MEEEEIDLWRRSIFGGSRFLGGGRFFKGDRSLEEVNF